MLMTFWNAHFRYHRRYGLEDVFTRIMTMAILVLVLFFVYPLKFLSTMLTVIMFGLRMHRRAPDHRTAAQVHMLYVIYGLGFAGVWSLYALLYLHALRKREQLELDRGRGDADALGLAQNLIYVGVCLLSIVLALTAVKRRAARLHLLPARAAAVGSAARWFGRRVRARGWRQSRMTTLPNSVPESM